MSGPASSRSPRPRTGAGWAARPREHGASWVTLLLLIVVAGAGYLVWVWAPLYLEFYEVKQIAGDYMNQAVKNPNDAELRARMLEKIRAVVQTTVVDERGRTTKVPAIPLEESDITWERDREAKTLHLAFEYEREFVYPFLDRPGAAVFRLDRTYDVSLPDWGPSR